MTGGTSTAYSRSGAAHFSSGVGVEFVAAAVVVVALLGGVVLFGIGRRSEVAVLAVPSVRAPSPARTDGRARLNVAPPHASDHRRCGRPTHSQFSVAGSFGLLPQTVGT